MTQAAIEAPTNAVTHGAMAPRPLWLGTRLFIQPRTAGAVLMRTPVWRTIVIALVNLFCVIPWAVFIQTTLEWVQTPDLVRRSHNLAALMTVASPDLTVRPHGWFGMLAAVQQADIEALRNLALPDFSPLFAGPLLFFCLAIAMAYFMLLPFVARHGSNRAAARQTARITLASTGLIHLVGAGFIGFYLLLSALGHPPLLGDVGWTDTLVHSIAFFAVLTSLGLLRLIRVAGVDYRWPDDLPERRDPLCENCGYNLMVTPLESRCPECGMPAAASLAPDNRVPTPWERDPQLRRVGVIARQLKHLVTAPRHLFQTMLLYSYKPPAERWLKGSILAVALAAFCVIPLTIPLSDNATTWADAPDLLANALSVGIFWAFLALMMVGVETTGLSTFSRMRGSRVDFAGAAKVTAYAAPLMLFWIFLGGLHALAAYYVFEHLGTPAFRHFHQLLLAHVKLVPYAAVGSLAAAHIGGLLWFEFTVYRGLKKIQYANQ